MDVTKINNKLGTAKNYYELGFTVNAATDLAIKNGAPYSQSSIKRHLKGIEMSAKEKVELSRVQTLNSAIKKAVNKGVERANLMAVIAKTTGFRKIDEDIVNKIYDVYMGVKPVISEIEAPIVEEPVVSESEPAEKPVEGKRFKEPMTSIEKRKDGTTVLSKAVEMQAGMVDLVDEKAILEFHGLDPEKWSVVSCSNNTWNGIATVDKETGESKIVDLYQSKITAKPRDVGELSMTEVEKYFESHKFVNKFIPEAFPKKTSGKILEVILADWHLGLSANVKLSGEKYNCEIAIDRLHECVGRIIAENADKDIREIKFVTLGDVMHVDNSKQTTTAGTFQQIDKPIFEIFSDAMENIRWAIESLAMAFKAPVEYIYIPGNHDRDTGAFLAITIENIYKDNPNVTCDVAPNPIKARMYGKTLVGYHHGDMNVKNLANLLPSAYRKLYALSERAMMKVGHLHHYDVNTKGAVPVFYMPTMAGSSDWEHQQGFISDRGMSYTLYDTEDCSYTDGFVSVA